MITSTRSSILPGFRLTLGYTLTYMGLLVLIPIAAIVIMSLSKGAGGLWEIMTNPRTLSAYRISLLGSGIAAIVNTVFGLIVAWVLVRFRFPGRKILDTLVDLPLALPTAVAGIALTAVYSPSGPLGSFLIKLGIPVAYTNVGAVLAMILVSLPFAVRTIQPVLEDLEPEIEEAAASLGASPLVTFIRVIFPSLVPAMLTGLALSFAKSLGEYGSVIFISSNTPMRSEITPLLIMTKVEEYDYAGASGVAVGLLVLSGILLLTINALQGWMRRTSP